MRRLGHLLLFFAIVLLACRAVSPGLSGAPSLPQLTAPVPAVTAVTPQTAAPPTRQPEVTATAVLLPVDNPQPEASYSVRFHPDDRLYVSDFVSLEVIAPTGVDLADKTARVAVRTPVEAELGENGFQPYGIAGRNQATFLWAWDTNGLEPGDYSLDFAIEPGGPHWTETVRLYPQKMLPPPQPGAQWQAVESQCCVLHYISGTLTARDLPLLLRAADAQAQDAMQKMGVNFAEPIQVTLIDRVLGHGGFAGSEIYISYLERNYAGSDFQQVLHHEMIHILDSRLGGELRPALFVEGLAVYLTGGHFRAEPLLARAAALLDLRGYLPLIPLADDFYESQHEIGYLEGGALIQYMVNRWGWRAFWNFYRDIHPQTSGKQADAIDAALQVHYGLTFTQLEQQFVAALMHIHPNPDLFDDLRLTVRYYNTVRRYQQLFDPSAYFLTAWLTDGPEMRRRGIVADFLRHPTAPVNVSVENLLVDVDRYMQQGEYYRADKTLAQAEMILKTAMTGHKEMFAPTIDGPP